MSIQRFIEAQAEDHEQVMKELKAGKKQTCWMWYTFPQIKGLGVSEIAKFYEIKNRTELRNFVKNHYLAENLLECMRAILDLPTDDPVKVFSTPIDAQKLQSSMTLFTHSRRFKYIAQKVLDKYFDGKHDDMSEAIIRAL